MNEEKELNPVPKNDMMEIEKKDFEKLMETIADQNKKIEVLFQVADKGRLAKVQSDAHGGSLIKTVKISQWPENNKYILASKLTTNQSEIINGRWYEKQDIVMIFEDGTSETVSLSDFSRKRTKEKAEIISRTRKDDSSGKETEILKVRLKDGKEIEIDSYYVN